MSAIGYEIHVLKKQEWALLKTFSADDKATAQNFFASLDRAMGYEGKKLIEEAVKDNGLLFSSTVSFQIFDPGPETKAPHPAPPRPLSHATTKTTTTTETARQIRRPHPSMKTMMARPHPI